MKSVIQVARKETVEEFLARGGKIKTIGPASETEMELRRLARKLASMGRRGIATPRRRNQKRKR